MIVELLNKNDKALSPYDMRDQLKKQRINPDVVTIYRVLETLEKLMLVHKVLALNDRSFELGLKDFPVDAKRVDEDNHIQWQCDLPFKKRKGTNPKSANREANGHRHIMSLLS